MKIELIFKFKKNEKNRCLNPYSNGMKIEHV